MPKYIEKVLMRKASWHYLADGLIDVVERDGNIFQINEGAHQFHTCLHGYAQNILPRIMN